MHESKFGYGTSVWKCASAEKTLNIISTLHSSFYGCFSSHPPKREPHFSCPRAHKSSCHIRYVTPTWHFNLKMNAQYIYWHYCNVCLGDLRLDVTQIYILEKISFFVYYFYIKPNFFKTTVIWYPSHLHCVHLLLEYNYGQF